MFPLIHSTKSQSSIGNTIVSPAPSCANYARPVSDERQCEAERKLDLMM